MSDDDDVSKLSVARFKKNTDPAAHDPVAALEAALEWVKSTPDKPHHIIVVTGRNTESGGSALCFFQSGSYTYHAQVGLLMEGIMQIRES